MIGYFCVLVHSLLSKEIGRIPELMLYDKVVAPKKSIRVKNAVSSPMLLG